MKGTIFLKPLEFNLEAQGEKWRQGETINGSLAVKNHSGDSLTLSSVKVKLAHGNYKKIKARDIKGWDFLAKKTLEENLHLSANAENQFAFSFTLPENCPVTDKNGSLYLAFFDKDEDLPAGHIELVIEPKLIISQVLQLFESFLRFKVKEIKSAKKMIEVKMSAPGSRELSHVDSLVLSLTEVEKTLTLKYEFNVRVLEMNGTTMSSEKKVKSYEQKLTSKQYLIYGDAINQDGILESIQSIINEVKNKLS